MSSSEFRVLSLVNGKEREWGRWEGWRNTKRTWECSGASDLIGGRYGFKVVGHLRVILGVLALTIWVEIFSCLFVFCRVLSCFVVS